ncbi:MAG: HNH endonuclease [Verrucomicrobia bacterium]|nr:HNH endonuclease [Pseudomonadota bacterium]NBS50577.1 HNH endonuclease [Verrucomicrobiota bacterium]NBS79560.1 HNH endonuclease [bacterium]NBT24118.1 HNH endonuclease [bacterium]NBV96442.1 HNH endonuclease [Verrucomicrobiota bacterium]
MDLAIPQGVLVLNRFWQAVHICSVRRAFTLLYLGHAQVVEGNGAGDDFRTFDFQRWRELSRDYEGEDAVRTISFRIRIPRVIVLMLFDRIPKKEVKLTRQNIFERDSYTCQYCGEVKDRRDLNLDHVIPRDHGGTTTWENVVCSCIPCNTRKGNRRPPQASMKLIRKPKRPKLRTFLNVQISRNGPETWRHFLDLAYWNVELSD